MSHTSARALRAVVPLAAALAFSAYAQDSDLSEGMRLYQQKGNCQACHGWAGDGRKTDNQAPDAPSLRDTKLDRDAIVLTIRCGRPGRGMPAFERLAYSDGRCYGMKDADVKKAGLTLADPAATLQPREIQTLVEFLYAKVIGKGPLDRAKCVEFWGSAVEACNEIKP